jgi:hypothetical protein
MAGETRASKQENAHRGVRQLPMLADSAIPPQCTGSRQVLGLLHPCKQKTDPFIYGFNSHSAIIAAPIAGAQNTLEVPHGTSKPGSIHAIRASRADEAYSADAAPPVNCW